MSCSSSSSSLLFGLKAPFPNDISKQLIDFLFKNITPTSTDPSYHIEIEAKFGKLIDNSTGNRIQLPITTETILTTQSSSHSNKWYHFESKITQPHFENLTRLFDNRAAATESSKYCQKSQVAQRDSFYTLPKIGKCRVSFDLVGSNVREIIQKTRLTDLHIHFPSLPYDVRISINSERSIPIEAFSPQTAIPVDQVSRVKVRNCYCQNGFMEVDLTKVTDDNGNNSCCIYELELEIKDFELIQREREKLANKQENKFVSLCNTFLNGIRTIPNLCLN